MKATQTERVLVYIEEFGSITQLEALKDLGVSSREAVKNRYGESCYIKRYSMKQGERG